MEPWYDYLAFPIAPLVLVAQLAALFVGRRDVRWTLTIACFGAVTAMLVYVSSLEPRPDEGVNIGAALLLLAFVASLVLLAVAAAREAVGAVIRGRRVRPR